MYERLLTLSDYFNYLNRRVPEELDHAFPEDYIMKLAEVFFQKGFTQKDLARVWFSLKN